MKDKRCIVITHQQALDSAGGGTQSYIQIAHQLRRMGIEVVLVPRLDRGTSPLWQQRFDQLRADGIEIFPAPRNQVHYLLNGLSVANIIRQLITSRSVDAVLSWDYEAAFLLPLLRSYQIPLGMIAAEPSYAMWANRQTRLRSVKRMTDSWFRWRPLKYADVVFVSSHFTQREITDLFGIDPDRVVITRRGIDPGFSQIQRSCPSQITNLIFYGSLAPLKGVFDAIQALGLVAQQGVRNWTFKIAGWGNEAAVQQALQEHGIADQTMLLGRLDAKALMRELEWAQLAILPSQAESFGRAIAEAQAASLPVVSYTVGSIPEIITHNRSGWLVPPHQIDQLATALITAMQNPEATYQMGIAGHQQVTETFTWEKTATSMLKGIEQAQQRCVAS